MIKGLTRSGIGMSASLEQFVRQAAAHGFGAVDSSGAELEGWAQQTGLATAQELLQSLNMRIGAIALPVEWRQDEATFRSQLAALAQAAQWAESFGVKACCTYVLPSTDEKAAHFAVVATRRLRICADILDGYGISLGLEFVGPHHLRTRWANPFLWTMAETLDWIGAIGRPNVGLLLDAYHWYTNEGTERELLELNPAQIVHVHLNDAKPVPVTEALDNDRIYPGEGVIDLPLFLRSLQTIGYRGVVSQEILTPQPPAQSEAELLARSQAAFDSVFKAAGLQ